MQNLVFSKLLIRLWAMFYDFCFVFALLFLFALIFTAIFKEIIFRDHPYHFIYQIYLELLFILYHFIFIKIYAQTPGMKICRLYLLDEHKNTLSIQKIILRYFWACLTIFLFLLAFIYALFNKNRFTLYDKLSKTYIYKNTSTIKKLKFIKSSAIEKSK